MDFHIIDKATGKLLASLEVKTNRGEKTKYQIEADKASARRGYPVTDIKIYLESNQVYVNGVLDKNLEKFGQQFRRKGGVAR